MQLIRTYKKNQGDEASIRAAVLSLAERFEYETSHAHQVAHLATRLFDQLRKLHQLDEQERNWLEYAALLHDIGWKEGWKGHHLASLNIILTHPDLPFDEHERRVIGLVARYHRRELPNPTHEHYSALNDTDQQMVSCLAAFVRLADALDRSRMEIVQDVDVNYTDGEILITCQTNQPPRDELSAAQIKTDLLAQVFDREVLVHWAC